jgi:AcrR family transcriptional regulator
MHDFCERLNLSRGGLYRYFDSTTSIFLAMLENDRESISAELDTAIVAGVPASQLLSRFFSDRKNEIIEQRGRLSVAVYEFCLSAEDHKEILENRYVSAILTLSRVIQYGQARGEFNSCNSEEMSRHIILLCEGLKISSTVVSISEMEIDSQFNILAGMVKKNNITS